MGRQVKPAAQYVCLFCKAWWPEEYDYKKDRYPGMTHCLSCGHLYVKWTNFEDLRGRHMIK